MNSSDYKFSKSMEGFDPASTVVAGVQPISSAFGSSSGATPRPQNRLNAPNFNASQMGASALLLQQNRTLENLKPGIPPSHPNMPPSAPYLQTVDSQSASHLLRSPNMRPRSSHSRSLSQPSHFSLDCLPPLSPSPYREPSPSPTLLSDSISTDVSMEENVVDSHAPSISLPVNRDHAFQVGHSLLSRKGHRRSSSDTPSAISGFIQSPPPLVPSATWKDLDSSVSRRETSGFEKPIRLVKKEQKKDEGHVDCYDAKLTIERKEDVMDDLISVYMNLENIDILNLSGVEDSKTVESSDNEVESHVIGKTITTQGTSSSCAEERREGIKRSSNGDIAPGARHRRSFSLDSSIGNLHIEDESPKLPPLGNLAGQRSPIDSVDGKTSEINMEFRNGEFSEVELKKIVVSEKLAEIASSDPKRAKRILANRQSAARSKERKVRYIAELEQTVQTLLTKTTTMSTQFTKLQCDNSELKSENNELKFRLQAMEQQSQLKDALNETLTAEVQRLRLTVTELGGESILASCMARQLAINQQRLQLQHQQSSQLKQSQLQNHHSQKQTQTQSHQIQHDELHQPQHEKATAY